MAKKIPPIKTDLFRFVTFRSPEEFDSEQHSTRFVTHPNLAESPIQSCPIPQDKPSMDEFENYVKTFPQYPTKDDVRNNYRHFYDFAMSAMRSKTPIASLEIPADSGVKPLNRTHVSTLFDALIGMVLSQKYPESRKAVTTLLIVNHALENKKEASQIGITRLTDLAVEIPREVFECRKPWFHRDCEGELEGVQNLGVADFRRVEQEVCCYLPGEVSHIENIMAKEYKERSTRNYVRTEDTLETETETTIENLSDLTTTTRNEISSEIASVLEQDKTSNYGGSVGVSANYMGAEINVNAFADFSTSNSSSYSNSEAQTYAEEVTKRALERIVQRTSQKRTSKIIKEFEENNKHGYDNRGDNAKNITGIYRWIDIKYINRLVNYGKRLMVEFMVPEPAEFYKTMLKYRHTDEGDDPGQAPEPPKTLESFGIKGPNDIDDLKLANAGSYFGVSVSPLPPLTLDVTKDLSPLAPVDHNRSINSQSLTPMNIPGDYEADKVIGSYTYQYRASSWSSPQQAFCDFTFGGTTVYSGGDYSGSREDKTVNINIDFSPNLPGSIPISVGYSGCFGWYGAVTFKCVLKQSVITTWQADAYNMLMNAYNQMLDAYNAEVSAQENDEAFEDTQEMEQFSPAMNRIIEQRELKRICIEMLMKPYCHVQGRDNNSEINACDQYMIPQVNQTSKFTEYTRTVKFFEQAIDWQLMSYLFYPYYWADKCDWVDLMKSKSDDMVFQAFLQSGMGRVVVPIREQFMRAFVYYLETGEVWTNNDLVPGSESDLYLSIEEEMQTIEGEVEKEWETRVPTSLAIIQGRSAFLEDEGLPCCELVENDETTSGILPSTDVLDLSNTPQ